MQETTDDYLKHITEREFAGGIVQQAKALGWLVGFVWNSKHSPAGFPDLTMVWPPRVIFAELKRMKGKTSVHQEQWLHELRDCPGVETYLWRPSDRDQIDEVLA